MGQHEKINLVDSGNTHGLQKLLGMEEVAEILGVSLARAYELARQKLIPAVQVGRQVRVHPGKLAIWIEQGGQGLSGGWKHKI